MKRRRYLCAVIAVCAIAVTALVGCDSSINRGNVNEVSYSMEDFESIIVGESTFQDVNRVAASEAMQVTSYGGFCEYPTQTGGSICIKFYGDELIVGSIEEVV